MHNKKTACDRMGGKVKGDVCFVGDFPTHIGFYDWWGETIISDALEKEGDAIVLLTSPEEAQEGYGIASKNE